MATKPKKKKILALTGATGFVGKSVLEKALSHNFEVKALTRKNQAPKENVTWIEGSLDNNDSLNSLIKGADVIIHLAGAVKALNWKGFESANVTGSANLAEQIKTQFKTKKKKPKIILVSSLAARSPWVSHYAASKRLGEKEFQDALNKDFPLTILRPPAVYGPGDKEILQMFKAFKKGFCPSIGYGKNRFSMIHVEDLANAIISLAQNKQVKNRVFELDDGHKNGYSTPELAKISETIFNNKIRTIPIPPLVIKLSGAINGICAQMINRPVMLTGQKANELNHNDWVAKNDILNEAGFWEPNITIEDGFQKTIAWYKENNLL